MADNTRERTVIYRRAEWANDNPASISLEMCIRQACAKLQSTQDRSIKLGDVLTSLASVRQHNQGDGVSLHITIETPGEHASIVPDKSNAGDEINVSTSPPPKNFEFMDGDAFAYVNGDDVCMCTMGIRDSGISLFLRELFKRAKIRKDSDMFALFKVANVKRLALIKDEGVKEIEIKATMFQAAADYNQRQKKTMGAAGALKKHINAVLGKDRDANIDSLRATISLKLDRRIRAGIKLGEKRLQLLAEDILKDSYKDDDFVIVTEGGKKITADEIFISSKLKIRKSGKTVDRDKAWIEVRAYYKTLQESGMI